MGVNTHSRALHRVQHLSNVLGSGSSMLPSSLGMSRCLAEDVPEHPTKILTPAQAVALIKDNDMVTMAGFVGSSPPHALLKALRDRFDATASPRNLGLMFIASVGNSKGVGTDLLAVDGLVGYVLYGWIGSCPSLGRMISENKIPAHNLPLGVLSHMYRDIAAKKVGPITRTGLGTFVDPREKGGKRNARTTEDVVSLVNIGGQELLHYRTPKSLDVALLRGTTADTDGNVSLEREVLLVDQLNQAMAVKNSGGVVIVQVERIVERHTIPSRAVHLPGVLVDAVVVVPAEHRPQSYVSAEYDGALAGEVRAPLHALGRLPMDERKVVAHRAFFELDHPRCLVNLGVGIPEGVAILKATHTRQNPHAATATLTTEAGVFGGVPAGGLRFGSGYNSEALVPTATMIDLYSGGGCDLAVLGMAQVDAAGNVNVHSFGSRAPGCGGFIDISQNSKKCVFTGTFTSGGLKVAVEDGKLRILREGTTRKFVTSVPEKTFAAARCQPGKSIFYVTERAVFKLIPGGGLELIEVAPGVDIRRDILAHMDFKPVINNPKLMDPRIFQP